MAAIVQTVSSIPPRTTASIVAPASSDNTGYDWSDRDCDDGHERDQQQVGHDQLAAPTVTDEKWNNDGNGANSDEYGDCSDTAPRPTQSIRRTYIIQD
jgi:hypothetical protein